MSSLRNQVKEYFLTHNNEVPNTELMIFFQKENWNSVRTYANEFRGNKNSDISLEKNISPISPEKKKNVTIKVRRKKGTYNLPGLQDRKKGSKKYTQVDDTMIETILLEHANSGVPLSDNFIRTLIVFRKDLQGIGDTFEKDFDLERMLKDYEPITPIGTTEHNEMVDD